MNPDRTRTFLDSALSDFRGATDSDSRLHSLWKISQLVDNATDEELHELAAAALVEEDHRVRGEICYTMSRSRKPQLVEVLRGMTQDDNSYVRRSAITAIEELSGGREATLAAMEPILEDVDRLRAALTGLEEKLINLRDSIEQTEETESTQLGNEIVMDEHMKCWETYLRNEAELLQKYSGMYVAIHGEKIVGIGESMEELAKIVYEKYGATEALICKIEEDPEPVQMPPSRVILGFQDNSS